MVSCVDVSGVRYFLYFLVLFVVVCVSFFFFTQKTAYEMRISDWSSDMCSSDLLRILFDKVADEWRNNALAEGNGARHIQRAARRPLTVAQRESLNPVFDHVSAAVRKSVRELGRGHDPGVALK